MISNHQLTIALGSYLQVELYVCYDYTPAYPSEYSWMGLLISPPTYSEIELKVTRILDVRNSEESLYDWLHTRLDWYHYLQDYVNAKVQESLENRDGVFTELESYV